MKRYGPRIYTHQPMLVPRDTGGWVLWEDVQKELKRLHKVIEAGRKVLCARECGIVVPEESAIILHKFYREEF